MVKISKLKFKLNAGKTDADAMENFKYFKNFKWKTFKKKLLENPNFDIFFK